MSQHNFQMLVFFVHSWLLESAMPLHVAFLIKLLVVSWHQLMDFSTQDQPQNATDKCKVTTQP